MALIAAEGMKAHYKRQFWNILTLIFPVKILKNGDTYQMAYGWFISGI